MRTQSDSGRVDFAVRPAHLGRSIKEIFIAAISGLGPRKKGPPDGTGVVPAPPYPRHIRVNGGHVSYSNQIGHEWQLMSS